MDGLKRLLRRSLSGSISDPSDGDDRPEGAQIRSQEIELVTPIGYDRAEKACSLIGMDFGALLDDMGELKRALEKDPPSVQDMQAFLEYVLTDQSLQYEYETEDGDTETRKLRLDCMPAGAADAFFLHLLTRFLLIYVGDFAKGKVAFGPYSSDPGSIPESWTIPMSPSN